MGHPMLDEFARSGILQERFLRQCQREFPKTFKALEEQVALLTAENADLRKQLAKKTRGAAE